MVEFGLSENSHGPLSSVAIVHACESVVYDAYEHVLSQPFKVHVGSCCLSV